MLESMIDQSKILERVSVGEELTFQDGIDLLEHDNLHVLGMTANNLRQKYVGDNVTFTSSSYVIIQMYVLQVVKYVHFIEKRETMILIH